MMNCKTHKIILGVLLASFIFLPSAYGEFGRSKNGVERFYHSNGSLSQELRFKNGFIVKKKTFYPNGRLLLYSKYKKGYPFLIKTFHKNGKLKSVWTRASGETKFYYPDGILKTVFKTKGENLNKLFPESFIFSGPNE